MTFGKHLDVELLIWFVLISITYNIRIKDTWPLFI